MKQKFYEKVFFVFAIIYCLTAIFFFKEKVSDVTWSNPFIGIVSLQIYFSCKNLFSWLKSKKVKQ